MSSIKVRAFIQRSPIHIKNWRIMMLKENERLDCLLKEQLEIIQNDEVFSFSTDALLLGHFTDLRKRDKVMDLCSGNGVIPLLLSDKGTHEIDAIEIQPQLVDMAKRSIQHNGLETRIRMYEMDLREVQQTFKPSSYNVVTCNPPYFKTIQTHQHQKEAHKIARHEIMCTLADCVNAAKHLLKQGGRLVMVHRAERLMDVLFEFRQHQIEPKRLTMVYSKQGKAAHAIIVEGRKAGNPGLDIAPPFHMYETNGDYTKEMSAIYYGS